MAMTHQRSAVSPAQLFDRVVAAHVLEDGAGVEQAAADRGIAASPDPPNSESKFLFYFLNVKLFLEEFAA